MSNEDDTNSPAFDRSDLERRLGFSLPAEFVVRCSRRSAEAWTLIDFDFPAIRDGWRCEGLPEFALVLSRKEQDSWGLGEQQGAFLALRRLLPIAVGTRVLLCIDASLSPRESEWPIRAYEPEFFFERNPDFVRWTGPETLRGIVASSFEALCALHDAEQATPDAEWGTLTAQFAALDPLGAGAASAFWADGIARYVRQSELSHWRRMTTVLGNGLDVQRQLYSRALNSLKRDPELVIEVAAQLEAPEFRVQGRILRARALAALSRHDENETNVLALAHEWAGPEVPLGPNQLLDRREMLELLSTYSSSDASRARAAVMGRPDPQIIF